MCALRVCVPTGTACSALLLDGVTNGSSRKKKWGGEIPRHFLLDLAALNSCYCHKCHPGQPSASWTMLHMMLYGTGALSAQVISLWSYGLPIGEQVSKNAATGLFFHAWETEV